MLRTMFVSVGFLSLVSIVAAAGIVGLLIWEMRKCDKRRELTQARQNHPAGKGRLVPGDDVRPTDRADLIAAAFAKHGIHSDSGTIR